MKILIIAENEEEFNTDLFKALSDPENAPNALIHIGEQYELKEVDAGNGALCYSISGAIG